MVNGEGDGPDGEYDEAEEDDEDDMGEDMDTAIEGGMTVEARRKQEKDHERYVATHYWAETTWTVY